MICRLGSKDVCHLSHSSSTCSGRKHRFCRRPVFLTRAAQGHPSLVLLNNLITQLFKARPGPNIEDIPLEPYPADTRKYLIILGRWPEIYPPTATLRGVLKAHMSFIPSQPAMFDLSRLYSCCHSPAITFQIELQFMPPWPPLNCLFLFNQIQA